MSIEQSPMSPRRSLALTLLTSTVLLTACRTSEQPTPGDPLQPEPPKASTVQNYPEPPSSEPPPLERLKLQPAAVPGIPDVQGVRLSGVRDGEAESLSDTPENGITCRVEFGKRAAGKLPDWLEPQTLPGSALEVYAIRR